MKVWADLVCPWCKACLMVRQRHGYARCQRCHASLRIVREPNRANCDHCGREFWQRRVDAIFCSDRCKSAEYRRRVARDRAHEATV